MMTNLFSIFDPSSIMNLSMNWISLLIIMMFMPINLFLIPNRFYMMIMNTINKMSFELTLIFKNNKFILIPISMFIMISFNNFFTLPPYIFCATSHLQMNMLLSLPIWLSFILMGWIHSTNNMFIHMVPKGTPSYLISFMVLIETISNMIRPLTLTVRLTANLIAGHLLLNLMSSMTNNLNSKSIPILIMSQSILMSLESGVAIIQAYVFMILISLYFMDSN
uniref:ATP synthase F0 subunit 6 n=1 Tax=Neucentropus mandjuricus TaxID=1223783 RepID=UPI0021148155|nr:ATP synthase F0 subunit 6 [Neucentropus mandjuricus]USL48462.1 ATP synthase F0 subunit 6 [Neucentropus mandjuricus]